MWPPPAELPTTMTHGLRYEIVQRVREGEGEGAAGDRGATMHGVAQAGLLLGQRSFDTCYAHVQTPMLELSVESVHGRRARAISLSHPVDMKLSLRGLPRGDGSRAPPSLTTPLSPALPPRLIRQRHFRSVAEREGHKVNTATKKPRRYVCVRYRE